MAMVTPDLLCEAAAAVPGNTLTPSSQAGRRKVGVVPALPLLTESISLVGHAKVPRAVSLLRPGVHPAHVLACILDPKSTFGTTARHDARPDAERWRPLDLKPCPCTLAGPSDLQTMPVSRSPCVTKPRDPGTP